MFCPYCGKEIKDTAKFCPICGSDLKNVKQRMQPEESIDQPVAETNEEMRPIQPEVEESTWFEPEAQDVIWEQQPEEEDISQEEDTTWYMPEEDSVTSAEGSAKKRNIIFAGVGLFIVVLIVAAILIWNGVSEKKKRLDNESSTAQESEEESEERSEESEESSEESTSEPEESSESKEDNEKLRIELERTLVDMQGIALNDAIPPEQELFDKLWQQAADAVQSGEYEETSRLIAQCQAIIETTGNPDQADSVEVLSCMYQTSGLVNMTVRVKSGSVQDIKKAFGVWEKTAGSEDYSEAIGLVVKESAGNASGEQKEYALTYQSTCSQDSAAQANFFVYYLDDDSYSRASGVYETDEKPQPEESSKIEESSESEQSQDDGRETAVQGGDSEYILPDSGSRYLTDADVKNLSKDELMYARNEIYARKGRRFNSEKLQNYFNSKSWYNGTIAPEDFTDSMLNQYEIANIALIMKYE